MRLIVCGTRTFNNKKLLYQKLNKITALLDDLMVVVGEERYGVGKLAIQWAEDMRFSYQIFHPDYDHWKRELGDKQGGKVAPIKRNSEMVDSCEKGDACVAFWDGDSSGTDDTIKKAKKRGLMVRVIYY